MPRTGKRRERKEDGEWMRPAIAARTLGIPRSTMTYRVMRGDFKTKAVAGVTLVWIDETARTAAA